MDSVLSVSFCHSSGPCLGTKLLRVVQRLARKGVWLRWQTQAERKGTRWMRKRTELRQPGSDQRSILLFGAPSYEGGGRAPIPAKSSWSPVSGDHVFGSRTARWQAAAVGVAEQ